MVDKVSITTPILEVSFSNLNAPVKWDANENKFVKDETGDYRVKLILDPKNKEHADLIKQIVDLENAALEETKETNTRKKWKLLSSLQDEIIDGKETGRFILTAKRSGSYELKVFDANGEPLDPVPYINRGSTIKLRLTLKPYAIAGTATVGLSRYINGTQVVELANTQQTFSTFAPTETLD